MASAAKFETVKSPAWALSYKGSAVTRDISRMVTRLTYTSVIHGGSPGLEFEVEDSRFAWQRNLPSRGDRVGLGIGYSDKPLTPCPIFLIDEIELSGPPDVVKFHCLAAFVTDSSSTVSSNGFDGDSLLGIAEKIAAKYDMTVFTAPGSPNPTFTRITQKQETDLAFLTRLADEYNYNFTVRTDPNNLDKQQLVFVWRSVLESSEPSLTISRQQITSFRFKNSTIRVYKNATATYLNPKTKENISVTVDANPPQPMGSTLPINDVCDDAIHAKLRATAALHRANTMYGATGSITGPGSPEYVTGNNIAIQGFGQYDGKYAIKKAVHTLTRDGYTTQSDLMFIPAVTGDFI